MPLDGGTTAPRTCPVCKNRTSMDSLGDMDPAAVAQKDNPGKTQAETVVLEWERGNVSSFPARRRSPLLGKCPPRLWSSGPNGPPHPFISHTSAIQGPSVGGFSGPGPLLFKSPCPRPDGQSTFGPSPQFRGPRPKCSPFRGPHPLCNVPHPGPDGPPPQLRGPCHRPNSQPPFEGMQRPCGPPFREPCPRPHGPPHPGSYGPQFRHPCPRLDGPPCDILYSEPFVPPLCSRGSRPRPDGLPCDIQYSGADGPPFCSGPCPRPNGQPPFEGPMSPFRGPCPRQDGPLYSVPQCRSDGPPSQFRGPHPRPDGSPLRFRGPCPRPNDQIPFEGPPQPRGRPPPPFRGRPGSFTCDAPKLRSEGLLSQLRDACSRPRGPPPFVGRCPRSQLGGPFTKTPLLPYPEAEEESRVDTCQEWTASDPGSHHEGTVEQSRETEHTETPVTTELKVESTEELASVGSIETQKGACFTGDGEFRRGDKENIVTNPRSFNGE